MTSPAIYLLIWKSVPASPKRLRLDRRRNLILPRPGWCTVRAITYLYKSQNVA
jgi:hypothetical protein